MGFKNKFFKVTSAITGGISSFVSVAMLAELIGSGDIELIIGVLSAGGIAMAAGYNTIHFHKKQKKELFQKKQLDILYLAVQNHGQLTPTQVALQTNTPIDETKELLDSLSDAGAMELQVSNRGNLVYTLIDEVHLQNYMEKIG
ncbi:hypothetical protein Fleli_1285 [Bernardetia litoralis DSM 6794]|uniref:Uncharacterized protein n=1 Tax=Bernardetia litoralis (strain ATCC 23117 / DSM 6794 / NBRC 15988 / NCIMB 1366 / Fx l1 / Sio-4) TaxID=880071 RepID=I4AID4_BERLS|nr:hypothetical protein [Bernardetia litoralis]AFM03719.1 hypothetical protein Fleli_1285 [Bernardetia litoralis DSM 6794]